MTKRVTLLAAGLFCALSAPALHALEEVGVDDFRVSHMGIDGYPYTGTLDFNHATSNIQTVAYNSRDNEYLAVYVGDTDDDPADDEMEVFGQRFDAATGEAVGGQIRLTSAGPDYNITVDAGAMSLAYNSVRNEYLLVFESDASGQKEIWAQRLANDANPVGMGNEYQISGFPALEGSTNGQAFTPAVAYNPNTDEYLAVWEGGGLTGEYEIYGQRLRGSDGAEIGTNDFRLSHSGLDGDTLRFARFPDAVVNTRDNQYLVVWDGNDVNAVENDIFAQRLDAGGNEVGADDFRVSDMGAVESSDTNAYRPRAVYNPLDNQFLVVWEGMAQVPFDTCNDGCMDSKFEIFGQRLSANGAEVGDDDFVVGTWGAPDDPGADAVLADVAFDPGAQAYVAVWNQGDYRFEFQTRFDSGEIFAQALSREGALLLPENLQVSAVGYDGSPTGSLPAVAARTGNGEFLTVFGGRGQSPLDFGENEVYGQRLKAPLVSGELPPLPPPPVVGPNPFKPNQSPVSVKNAGANGRVQVYDFAGEKIRELIADGAGDVQWDGRNDAGEIVATGTYFLHFDVGDRIVKVGIQN